MYNNIYILKNIIRIIFLIFFTCYICNYIDGKRNSEYKSYYSNGQFCYICNYIDGKINGEYKRYYDNKQLWEICNYIDGKRNGEYKQFSEDGILVSHKIYENDVVIHTIL